MRFPEDALGSAEHVKLGPFDVNLQEPHFATITPSSFTISHSNLSPLSLFSGLAELRNAGLNRDAEGGALPYLAACLRVHDYVWNAPARNRAAQDF